jgi:hypothetical protein
VVIVNISRHGSHALIVTPEAGLCSGPAVVVVDLPATTAAEGFAVAQAELAAAYVWTGANTVEVAGEYFHQSGGRSGSYTPA